MTSIRGLEEAARKLREIGEEGDRIASREIVSGALNVQRSAKANTPVRKGGLRNSIVVGESHAAVARNSALATDSNAGPNSIVTGMRAASIGTDRIYARAIHWGTRHHGGVQFLFNAMEQERRQVVARLRAELKKLERS